MKFKNANEMILDKMILLGDKSSFKILGYNNQVSQPFHWCYLKDEPEKIFCLNQNILKEPLYRTDLDNEILGNKTIIIDLKGFLYNTLNRILKENIDRFINRNINNITYLFEKNETDYENISLYEMGKDIRENQYYGLDSNIRILLNNFEYEDISAGLLKISTRTGNTHFIFDIKKMCFKNDEIDIFKNVYGLSFLKKILAFEQYKRGLTPPFYNEIARINEFLEEKKTVTLLLNDGEKKQVPAQISYILATNYKDFWINTQLDNMNISNLKGIGYGKRELIIDTENLMSIDKQLEQLIEKYENNDLETEEIEYE